MFLVDDTREKRTEKIRQFMNSDVSIAVIIAAADFEWTCRRCILALGSSPTKVIKLQGGVLYRCSGLDAYKDAWGREVKPRYGVTLPEVIKGWDVFKSKAFTLRNRLIHGISGSTGLEYGRTACESILGATHDLTVFAETQGEPIYGRRIVRRKIR